MLSSGCDAAGCQQGRTRQRSRACQVKGTRLRARAGESSIGASRAFQQRRRGVRARPGSGACGAPHAGPVHWARVSRCAHLRPRRELATLWPQQYVLEVELRVLLDAQRVRQTAGRQARHAQHTTGDRVPRREPTQERRSHSTEKIHPINNRRTVRPLVDHRNTLDETQEAFATASAALPPARGLEVLWVSPCPAHLTSVLSRGTERLSCRRPGCSYTAARGPRGRQRAHRSAAGSCRAARLRRLRQ